MSIPLSKIQALEEAFRHDCSHEEAAAQAKVTLADLYDYIATHDEWYQQCLLSAHEPIAKAKMNLGQAVLKNDIEASKYLLERKRPLQWSPRAQLDINDTRPMVVLPTPAKTIIDVVPTQQITAPIDAPPV